MTFSSGNVEPMNGRHRLRVVQWRAARFVAADAPGGPHTDASGTRAVQTKIRQQDAGTKAKSWLTARQTTHCDPQFVHFWRPIESIRRRLAFQILEHLDQWKKKIWFRPHVVHSGNEKNSRNFSSFFPSDGKIPPGRSGMPRIGERKIAAVGAWGLWWCFWRKKKEGQLFLEVTDCVVPWHVRCSSRCSRVWLISGRVGVSCVRVLAFFFFFSHPKRFRMIFRPHPDVLLVRWRPASHFPHTRCQRTVKFSSSYLPCSSAFSSTERSFSQFQAFDDSPERSECQSRTFSTNLTKISERRVPKRKCRPYLRYR